MIVMAPARVVIGNKMQPWLNVLEHLSYIKVLCDAHVSRPEITAVMSKQLMVRE